MTSLLVLAAGVLSEVSFVAWTDYSPTWSQTGGASNTPDIGNGELEGAYVQNGKLTLVRLFFKAGSTTDFSDGDWRFSLPPGIQNVDWGGASNQYAFVGSGEIVDSSGTAATGLWRPVIAHVAADLIERIVDAGTQQSLSAGSSPITWATDDRLHLLLAFETT